MNKLTGMSKLAGAYWAVIERGAENDADTETLDILEASFQYTRRSLRIEDLRPLPKCTEGFNGRMPTQL